MNTVRQEHAHQSRPISTELAKRKLPILARSETHARRPLRCAGGQPQRPGVSRRPVEMELMFVAQPSAKLHPFAERVDDSFHCLMPSSESARRPAGAVAILLAQPQVAPRPRS